MDTLTILKEVWGAKIDERKMLPQPLRGMVREDLPTLLHRLGFKNGAEVGVERGIFSEVLLSKNPGSHLFCVDPWTEFEDMGEGYQNYNQLKMDHIHAEAVERLAPYNVTFIRKFSVEAVKDIPKESLDFVYIDGNHELSHVIHDLVEWSKRVKPDGIISGHDYKHTRSQCFSHVVQAVKAYVDSYQIAPWFTIGAQEVIQGEARDGVRSFLWVKP